jgi:hypothetical protein
MISLLYSFLVFRSFHFIEPLLQLTICVLFLTWILICHTCRIFPTLNFAMKCFTANLSLSLASIIFTFQLISSTTLSLEARATTKWKSKNMTIFYRTWHGTLSVWGKPSASKSTFGLSVGSWEHLRSAAVWVAKEWGLDSLSVLVSVSTTAYRKFLPTLKQYQFSISQPMYSGLELYAVPFTDLFSPKTSAAFSPDSPILLFWPSCTYSLSYYR